MTKHPNYSSFEYHSTGNKKSPLLGMDFNTQPWNNVFVSILNKHSDNKVIWSIIDYYKNKTTDSILSIIGKPYHLLPAFYNLYKRGDEIILKDWYNKWSERRVEVININNNWEKVIGTFSEWTIEKEIKLWWKKLFTYINALKWDIIWNMDNDNVVEYIHRTYSVAPWELKRVIETNSILETENILSYSRFFAINIWNKWNLEINEVWEWNLWECEKLVIKDLSELSSWWIAVSLHSNNIDIKKTLAEKYWKLGHWTYYAQIMPFKENTKDQMIQTIDWLKKIQLRPIYSPNNNEYTWMIWCKFVSYKKWSMNNTSSSKESIIFENDRKTWKRKWYEFDYSEIRNQSLFEHQLTTKAFNSTNKYSTKWWFNKLLSTYEEIFSWVVWEETLLNKTIFEEKYKDKSNDELVSEIEKVYWKYGIPTSIKKRLDFISKINNG